MAGDEISMDLPENYIWMTINQLQNFIKYNNYINIQVVNVTGNFKISSSMKTIRIGVLGAASIVTRSIIPEIYKLKNKFSLVGIASRDKNKAISLSKKYDSKAFFSYDDLINSSKLDAIYIPFPNALHYEYAKRSLKKGTCFS